jgi:hypothetical protein
MGMRAPWWHRHFLIGSDDHLRALGLLTVDFGAADEALAEYISSLSDIVIAEDPHLKERLQDLNFSAKSRVSECLFASYRTDTN